MSKLKRALRRDAEAFIPSREKKSPPRKLPLRRLVACACAFVLFVSALAVTGTFLFRGKDAPSFANCYFSVDINPSIEFVTGENGTVENVSPKNKYADALLSSSNTLAGRDAESVLVEILALAQEAGYLDKTQKNNAVLINILCENPEEQEKITELLKRDAQKFFEENYIFGVVLTSTATQRSNAEAQIYNITPAKLELVEEILKYDPVTYTKTELAAMPVRELNGILVAVKEHVDVFDDELEELEELVEDLVDLLEEFEEEEDDEEEGEMLEEANELIAEINQAFGTSYPQLGEGDDCKILLNGMLDELKIELRNRKQGYRDFLSSKSEEVRKIYENNLKSYDEEAGKREFEEDYEDWLELYEDIWEDQWEVLYAQWRESKNL